jgi:glycosyltransferase involved in cell wall biosynthesis
MSAEVTEAAPISIAVFAHNEARRIERCLAGLAPSVCGERAKIYVLVNGSRDRTEELVRAWSKRHPQVVPVVLGKADKANAWNHYVGKIAPSAAVHVFVDGDTYPLPGSVDALVETLARTPAADAAGAFPATGRNRHQWSGNMRRFGRLAGCLYALRGSFIDDLRQSGRAMPFGIVGEDLFLSCVVKRDLAPSGLFQPDQRLVFAAGAHFAFDSLSPLRPRDLVTYARRLVRYRIRDRELALLLHYLQFSRGADWPATIAELYQAPSATLRYRWQGRATLVDWAAVWLMRRRSHADSVDWD